MSASLPFPTESRNKWKKRKRDTNLGSNSKRQRPEDEDEDDEEDDDVDADEDEDLHPINPAGPTPTTTPSAPGDTGQDTREREVLSDGGVRISDFPAVVKHIVNRLHPSVLAIVAAERALQFADNRTQQNPYFFENISHGQLQALSAVPADSPSLAQADQDRAEGSSFAYVITPPAIMEGRGVVKRFGNNRVLVVPMHADWFSPNSVHRLERQVVPQFFSGKSGDHTPEKYMECRNRIVAKYMENPEKRLSFNDCNGLGVSVEMHDLNRIFRFLDHWGIINYSVATINHEPRISGQYLKANPNGELMVPSAALRSIDSLIQFEKSKSRLRPADVSASSSPGDEFSDLESRIRECLSENHCNCCSRPLPRVHYQSQKEADVLLCLDCFHEGMFVIGHSSMDFIRVDSSRDLYDLDRDNWTDQETLLLLEALEIYNDNWNDIAEHVGTKSKAQCILHFIRLPMEDSLLENIEVPSKSISSSVPNTVDDGRQYATSNGDCAGVSIANLDSESRLPFASAGNPLMALVAFLASAVGPRVAAACAHASLAALSKEDHQVAGSDGVTQVEGETVGVQGLCNQNDAISSPLPIESVRIAAKYGLAAAATKAKLFADHEEREIQRMAATIINHQLKRLELKLKQFAEVETLLMKECEQVERTRQRLAAERARVMSTRFGPMGTTTTLPAAAATVAVVNNNAGTSRQQVISASPSQTNISGYANNQLNHPNIFMPRQPMFAFGPRLPLSAIHQPVTPTTSNAMYTSAPGNMPPALSHPMLRPVSGTNTNVG
ncbi:PREDICTED: SWI/SNF complex subunit SWI3C [Nelumbo nucifera]|uniref:SWI/SNF complex subunit SWI3C n=1 Tax=Nelumbo nucifera TaxID=4432 RepID=A0A1U8AN96_NELNU|nr:PREDICTED: SWI/SNF complex subunit SWI3C [Nelumbo nucifera]